MKIQLVFPNIFNDVKDAVAHIHVEDQSEADAPSIRLASECIELPITSKLQPSVTVELDLNLDPKLLKTAYEIALFVRVKGCTPDEQPIEFLNTTTVPLPTDLNGSVKVILSRIV